MANSTKKEKLKAEDKEDEKCRTSKATSEEDKPEEEQKSIDKPEDKEDVEKASEDEDTSDLNDEEKAAYIKLKSRVKKRAIKSATGESPAEVKPNTDANSITPNLGVPSSPQHILVPQSSITVAREQNTPMGKSANLDLAKSPLYTGLSEQIEATRLSLDSKMASVEKSYNDRLDNLQKELVKTEEVLKKFYSQSFYKAAAENVSPEGTQSMSVAKQIELGKAQFRM